MIILFWILVAVAVTAGLGWLFVPIDEVVANNLVRRRFDAHEHEIRHP